MQSIVTQKHGGRHMKQLVASCLPPGNRDECWRSFGPFPFAFLVWELNLGLSTSNFSWNTLTGGVPTGVSQVIPSLFKFTMKTNHHNSKNLSLSTRTFHPWSWHKDDAKFCCKLENRSTPPLGIQLQWCLGVFATKTGKLLPSFILIREPLCGILCSGSPVKGIVIFYELVPLMSRIVSLGLLSYSPSIGWRGFFLMVLMSLSITADFSVLGFVNFHLAQSLFLIKLHIFHAFLLSFIVNLSKWSEP